MSTTPLQPAVGASVVLRATVASAALTNKVTFNENGTTLPGCGAVTITPLPGATNIGVATCTITGTTAGLHNYVVTYLHTADNGFEQVVVPVTPLAAASGDYTDMWWAGLAENGWGVSITQHGRLQFVVLYAYDASGKPVWYVLPSGTWNAANNTYTGALYQPTSSHFNSYRASNFNAGASVGTATITYTGSGAATLSYTINGVEWQQVDRAATVCDRRRRNKIAGERHVVGRHRGKRLGHEYRAARPHAVPGLVHLRCERPHGVLRGAGRHVERLQLYRRYLLHVKLLLAGRVTTRRNFRSRKPAP
ncbi:MAG: hypothetical protein IPP88_04105 [Betaproteobacteria bacterium]|nr:hypothetical protein [Betaproteobacteria bacterium]